MEIDKNSLMVLYSDNILKNYVIDYILRYYGPLEVMHFLDQVCREGSPRQIVFSLQYPLQTQRFYLRFKKEIDELADVKAAALGYKGSRELYKLIESSHSPEEVESFLPRSIFGFTETAFLLKNELKK